MPKKTHNYRLRSLEEVFTIAQIVSRHFSHPDEVMTGIYELLINALEHGNLGIDAPTKNALLISGKWKEEVQRRLSLPENISKYVDITVVEDEDYCHLTIKDQGDGFDWRAYVTPHTKINRLHGNGLRIVQSTGFNEIIFNEKGNEVSCTALQRKSNE